MFVYMDKLERIFTIFLLRYGASIFYFDIFYILIISYFAPKRSQ